MRPLKNAKAASYRRAAPPLRVFFRGWLLRGEFLSGVLALFLCALDLHAIAGTEWKPLGPSGGNFLFSIANPANPSQITVVTRDPCCVYRSGNGGAAWSTIGEIPSATITDACASSFTNLYAVSYSGCYRSSNGGADWDYASFPPSLSLAYLVRAHPTDPNIVFAAGYAYDSGSGSAQLAFFKSVNQGEDWDVSSFLSFSSFFPYGFAISKSNPNVMYVSGLKYTGSTYLGALLRSTNGGLDWSDISSAVDSREGYYFNCVAIDPTDANRVYVGGSNFYTSANGGDSWAKNSSLSYVSAIGIDPANTSNLYAVGNAVYVSKNKGDSWATKTGINGKGVHVEIPAVSPSTIFISTSLGFFKSTNGGENWASSYEGIWACRIPALAAAPSCPTTLFIEKQGYNVLDSHDSGNTWTDLPSFQSCDNVCALVVHRQNPDIVLALVGGG